MKKYALFAGPRLDSVIAHGSVALVGDASHRKATPGNGKLAHRLTSIFSLALSGAFGKSNL